MRVIVTFHRDAIECRKSHTPDWAGERRVTCHFFLPPTLYCLDAQAGNREEAALDRLVSPAENAALQAHLAAAAAGPATMARPSCPVVCQMRLSGVVES